MNSLIRRVGLLQLQSQQPFHLHQRVQPVFIGSHWQPGNRNVYKRKPKVKTLHFEKAKLLAVLKPIRPDPDEGKPMWETCDKVKMPYRGEPPLTQYEHVLRNELVKHLTQSKFIAAVTAGPTSRIDKKRCAVYLGQNGMLMRQYTKRVLRAGLLDTEYENLLTLLDPMFYLVFCKEPTVKEMLGVFKKYPRYVVLGGFTEGRILSRTHIEEYAQLPSLDIARAEFVSVLNSASSYLLRTLGTSQSVLVSHLESRAEELKKSCAPPNTPNEQGQPT